MTKQFSLLTFVFLWIPIFGQDYSKFRIPCEPVVYPIHYHHVISPHFTIPRDTSYLNIQGLIESLNIMFEPTCIQFQLCKSDTILDYNYFYYLDDPNTMEDYDMASMYNNPWAINVYRVKDLILKQTYMGNCKYRLPYILVNYDDSVISVTTQNAFARQMFNYFGLSYTNSHDTSKEWVNTLNSHLTADSLWDTPADPISLTPTSFPDTLQYQGSIPPFEYYVSNRKDANGHFYNPMLYNLMAENKIRLRDRCQILTHEQYQRVIRIERMCRKRFWGLK